MEQNGEEEKFLADNRFLSLERGKEFLMKRPALKKSLSVVKQTKLRLVTIERKTERSVKQKLDRTFFLKDGVEDN